MNPEEFHRFIAAAQENICQITALKNGVTLIHLNSMEVVEGTMDWGTLKDGERLF